jgi:hypothetical protein
MGVRGIAHSSVIIDDLHIDRARRIFWPLEANPPLVVDTDAVHGSIAAQRLTTALKRGAIFFRLLYRFSP